MGSVDPANEAELALEVIDYYNKHKGAKLQFVCMKRANVLFCYLIHYYITFTAVDDDTGCIGTYQAALVKRHSVSIIGLFRDANAHKTLSLLSIKGAEEEVIYKLNQATHFRAKGLLKDESSSCDGVRSDVHAGADDSSSLATGRVCLVN